MATTIVTINAKTDVTLFSTSDIAALTPANIAALTKAQQESLNGTQASAFSAAQLAALPVKNVPSDFFTGIKIAALSALPLGSLSADQISGLTVDQVGALTSVQTAKLGATVLASLGVDFFDALLAGKGGGFAGVNMTYLGLNISTFGAPEIANLTPKQLTSLSTAQVAALTSDQTSGLTPSQAAALPASFVKALTYDGVSGLTGPTLAAIPAKAISGLSVSNIGGLTQDNLPLMTSAQVAALSAAQITNLGTNDDLQYVTPTALAGLTKSNIGSFVLTKLSGDGQFAALTPTQLTYLSNTQLNAITTDMGAVLTSADITALSAAKIKQIGGNGTDTTVFANIPDTAFAGFNMKNIASLSDSQLKQLTVSQAQMLTPSALKGMISGNVNGGDGTDLGNDAFAAIQPSSLAAMSTAAFAGINATTFSYITADQAAALSLAEMSALPIGTISASTGANIPADAWAAFSSAQLNQLSAAKAAVIGSAGIQALAPTAIPGLNLSSFSAASGQASVTNLTADQAAYLTPKQILKLPAAGAAYLSYDAISAMPNNTFKALTASSYVAANGASAPTTPGQLGTLANATVQALTTSQLATLSPADGGQLESFTQQQVYTMSDDVKSWLTDIKGYITITASAGTTQGIETSTTVYAPAAGGEVITAGKKAVSIIGGAGVDAIYGGRADDTISGGGAADSIYGGAGNDGITITNHTNLVALATLDGGAGNDTLSITTPGATLVDADFASTVNMETLKLVSAATAGTSLGANFAAAGFSSIIGATGADAITFGNSTVGINVSMDLGSAASDDITGSPGADSLTFTTAIGVSGGTASVDGGASSDTIKLKDGVANYAYVEGGTGQDIINLGVAHTGSVTVAQTAAVDNSTDTISNFIKGSSGDVLEFSISAKVSGTSTAYGFLNGDGATAIAAADTIDIAEAIVTSNAMADTTLTADNVVVLVGTVSDAATMLSTVTAHLEFAVALSAGTYDIPVVWSDGATGHVTAIHIVSAGSGTDGSLSDSTNTVTNGGDMYVLNGLSTIATGGFDISNFGFIA